MKLCGCVGQGKKKPEQEKESQGGIENASQRESQAKYY
jgi:hypothetical protein